MPEADVPHQARQPEPQSHALYWWLDLFTVWSFLLRHLLVKPFDLCFQRRNSD